MPSQGEASGGVAGEEHREDGVTVKDPDTPGTKKRLLGDGDYAVGDGNQPANVQENPRFKRARTDDGGGSRGVSESCEEGEIADETPTKSSLDASSERSQESPQAQRPVAEAQTSTTALARPKPKEMRRMTVPEANGWNFGVSNVQVQVSLDTPGASNRNPRLPTTTSDNLVAYVPDQPQTFTDTSIPGVALKLPAFTVGGTQQLTTRQERATNWAKLLVKSNPPHADLLTPEIVRDAFSFYLRSESFLTTKRQNHLRRAAQDLIASGEMATNLNDARAELPLREDPAALRRLFPFKNKTPPDICLSCWLPGHVHTNCPNRNCKFCGSDQHLSRGCPTKQRCEKCRVPGHTAEGCTNRLRLTDEELDCVWCGEKDHQDRDCLELFITDFTKETLRTFKKVNNLIAYCATCGAEGHFYSDCPDRFTYVRKGADTLNRTPLPPRKSAFFSKEAFDACYDPNSPYKSSTNFVSNAELKRREEAARNEEIAHKEHARREIQARRNESHRAVEYEAALTDDDGLELLGKWPARSDLGKSRGNITIALNPAGNTIPLSQASTPTAPTAETSHQPATAAENHNGAASLPARPPPPSYAAATRPAAQRGRGRGSYSSMARGSHRVGQTGLQGSVVTPRSTSYNNVPPPPSLDNNDQSQRTGHSGQSGQSNRGNGRGGQRRNNNGRGRGGRGRGRGNGRGQGN